MIEPDLQRWSREVAEDPGAPSFIRLARAYRRQGRPHAARDLVLAGLERNPEHVEAHALLALLHVEDGEHQGAHDEWDTVLRLDPDNFAARRGLGFLALERGDLDAARRHLDAAAHARPGDPAVAQARHVLQRHETARASAEARGAPAAPVTPAAAQRSAPVPERTPEPTPGAVDAVETATPPDAKRPAGAVADEREEWREPEPGSEGEEWREGERGGAGGSWPGMERGRGRGIWREESGGADPLRLFDPLTAEGPFMGALLLDAHGLAVAGALERNGGEPDLLAGLLSTAVVEARRTARLMGMGAWEGLLLDCGEVTLHLAPVQDTVLVVAARRGAPAGWVVRTADRARELAERFLEVGS